jgi:predicted membrane chloride channel (bestrophin family)
MAAATSPAPGDHIYRQKTDSSFEGRLQIEKQRRSCWNTVSKPFQESFNFTTRRKLPEYDADISIFATIFSWRGTILPMVITRPIFWMQIILHLTLAYIDYSPNYDLPELAWTTLTIPTSLVVFFIVFYAGQSYARFFALYGHCVGISGGIMCWVAMIKVTLSKDATIRWNCTRYLLACQHMVYYSLHAGAVTDEEWAVIVGREMLTIREIEVIKSYEGFKPLLLITWALDEVKFQIDSDKSENAIVTSMNYRHFQGCAFEIRGHMSQIINQLKQPVPWPYFHLLNLMVLVTLTLVAYGLVGYGDPILTFFIHSIICTIFIGMKNLAVAMSDPFGDDAIDFKLEAFLNASYGNAIAHFMDEHVVLGDTCPEGMMVPMLPRPPVSTMQPKSTTSVSFQKDEPSRATEKTVLLAGKAE